MVINGIWLACLHLTYASHRDRVSGELVRRRGRDIGRSLGVTFTGARALDVPRASPSQLQPV